MFAFQREILPATSIDDSIACNITTSEHQQIITVATNIIKVYTVRDKYSKTNGEVKEEDNDNMGEEHDSASGLELHPDEEVSEQDKNLKLKQAADLEKEKQEKLNNPHAQTIEHVLSWKSSARIASVKTVRFIGDSVDSIIVSFPIAKIAILKYDAAIHQLTTRSMHFFEEPHNQKEFNKIGKTIKNGMLEYEPVIRVDPENRCACVLVYNRGLVILPFRRILSSQQALKSITYASELSSHTENTNNIIQSSKVLSSYSICIDNFPVQIAKVIDIEFLHGYNNPTLIILYEKELCWTGRTDVRHDTCGTIVVSINTNERTNPIVWKTEFLPYDCLRLQAVPMPLGGAIIVTPSTMIWLDQSSPLCSVKVNCLGGKHTNFRSDDQTLQKMSLEGSISHFIKGRKDKIIFCLKDGEIYIVQLMHDRESPGVKDFNFLFCEKLAVVPSSFISLDDASSILFVSSRIGSSFLVSCQISYTEHEISDVKKQLTAAKNVIAVDDDPEELMLYGTSTVGIPEDFLRTHPFLGEFACFCSARVFEGDGPVKLTILCDIMTLK